MKYKITVNNQTYEVEIEDINVRPIVAVVDGERFEVSPERGASNEITPKVEKKAFNANQPSAVASTSIAVAGGNILTSPLPGTIVNVFVKAGEKVETGQVVLVIEAMKMKNSIRSLFSGTIGEVCVETGQSVAHKQALIKFTDLSETAWM
jgi:glutaconyl-CoA/methylmalonyl-CoA decarboxylase subunit gamma